MTQQEASVTVGVAAPQVERRLRDVTFWGSFLIGVGKVTKTSHDRYVFHLDDGRDLRVAVRWHPREHSFTWRALGGAVFEGSLRLAPVNSTCTRLSLQLTTRPAGFVANLTEMIGTSRARAEIDLQRLDSFVHERAS
jgi:hypothetical protein